MPRLTLRPLLELPSRAPSFRLLFLATLGSGLGTNLAVIALTVDVFDRTQSGVWVAGLLLADFLPMLAIGLLLGPLVDRFSRRRLMIASDLARFAAFVALLLAPSAAAIVALAAVVGLATGLFRPAVYAGMPNLVDERDLPHANSLFQSAENATWMLGPLIGGALLSVSSPDVPYLVNAVTFLLSAGLIARIPEGRLQAERDVPTRGHWRDLAEGFAAVRSSPALLTVVFAWSIAMLGSAGVNVSEVALAKESLDAGDFGFGVLMASAGLGLVLGSLVAGAWIQRTSISAVYGIALALMAAGAGAAAGSASIWIAAVCVVVFGFGNGAATVCNPLFVQRGAPDHVRGRAFTVVMTINFAALGLGMVAAGPLTDAFGARWVWAAAGATQAVAALVGFVLARRERVPAAELPELPPVAAAAARAAPPGERTA